MTLGVRCAVIDEGRAVLLVRPRLVPGWQFPGGGIEVGETAAEAVRRELYEEARIELTGEPELLAREFRVLAPRDADFEILHASSSLLKPSRLILRPARSDNWSRTVVLVL
jgi:8-oxo-dGTP pyrophosphatase MutT (NUDIX family)